MNNENLEKGSNGSDNPEKSVEKDLQNISETLGGIPVVDATPFIRDRFNTTAEISCSQNQQVLVNHLNALNTEGLMGKYMTDEQVWETAKHSQKCGEGDCWQFYCDVVTQDR